MGTPVNSNFSNTEPIGICPAVKTKVIFMVWVVVYSLWVPVFLSVLYICFKKWKKCPSANCSHSDVFTFNITLTGISSYIGAVIILVSMYSDLPPLVVATGYGLMIFDGFGQMFFHSFTCVDRYLAVVHPVTYLGLKKQSRVTARNIMVASVWLLCVGNITLASFKYRYQLITLILISCLTLAVVMFCTIAVLHALIRPKPGEIARVKKSSDQFKRKAFYTIAFILVTLVLRFVAETLLNIINLFGVFEACFLPVISLWFSLPSSLVLPLLFLHRAGAVKACRQLCET